MASNVKAVFSQRINDDGETSMFVIEKNNSLRIRKGQYSITMSYCNRKVYSHIQNKAMGTSTSLPDEVMLPMAGLGEEISAVRDFVKICNPRVLQWRSCVVGLKYETIKLKASADDLPERIEKKKRS